MDKLNLSGLHILVRNRKESTFVLRLARRGNYKWRNLNNNNRRLRPRDRSVYLENRFWNGDMIYSFDYNPNPEYDPDPVGEMSCFGYDDGTDSITTVMLEWNLTVVEASELMAMGEEELELFLRLR